MPEFKGLGASFAGGCFSEFHRAKEPMEGNDDDVNDVSVEEAFDRVVPIKDFRQLTDDGGVDWVGLGRGGVIVFHGFLES